MCVWQKNLKNKIVIYSLNHPKTPTNPIITRYIPITNATNLGKNIIINPKIIVSSGTNNPVPSVIIAILLPP